MGFAQPNRARPTQPAPWSSAERKFYRTGQEKGTRAAFLAFLADDAIVFRPGPVNGKGVWEKRAETGLDLIWEPTFAAIARSADFGYTTGPAKWKANKKEEKFLGYGQFVSIWKKQKDGSWKVALDLGIENPEPTGKPEPLRLSVPDADSNAKVDFDVRHKSVAKKRTNRFVRPQKQTQATPHSEPPHDGIRVYREGSFPAVGKECRQSAVRGESRQDVLRADGRRHELHSPISLIAMESIPLIATGDPRPVIFFRSGKLTPPERGNSFSIGNRLCRRRNPDGRSGMDAGGVTEISRWRKPPVTTQNAASPGRATESVVTDSAALPGPRCLAKNRWLAPPANFQRPSGATRSCMSAPQKQSGTCGSTSLRVFGIRRSSAQRRHEFILNPNLPRPASHLGTREICRRFSRIFATASANS